jgi:heme exporter protein A
VDSARGRWDNARLLAMTTSPATAAPLLSAHRLAFSRNDEPIFGPLDFSLGRG